MIRVDTPSTKVFLAVLASLTFAASSGPAHAGAGQIVHRRRDQVDPHRGQYDYIRGGLGPALLPYARHGHPGQMHRYPKYPLFHGPIPAGPGDPLYETGRFPWQRG